MNIGRFAVDIVTDGTLLLDGGSIFGAVPKAEWEQQLKPDRRNRVRLGLNCLLIQTPEVNVLVDTGVGTKRTDKFKDIYGLNGNKLLKGLKALGLTARDINKVVLTHLHFDHGGGCTKLDRDGRAVPTFPKATYMVQQACWDDACKPNERARGTYYDDDFLPLMESEQIEFLDGDSEIAPGIRVQVTDGHADGHQIVLIEGGGERIAYVGDLIPTPYHLPLPCIAALDQTPNNTLAQKREIVRMVADGGWLVIFGHAYQHRAGYVEQRNGKAQLRPVDI